MTELEPVNLQLTASGISDVLAVFKSLESAAKALESKLDSISNAGAGNRKNIAKDESNTKSAFGKKELTDAEKAEQDKTKAAAKWAKRREQIVNNSAAYAGRLAIQQANAEIREAERSYNARVNFSKQLSGRIVNDFRSTLGHATRIFGTLTALGGGISIKSAYDRELAISKRAQDLSLSTETKEKDKNGKIIPQMSTTQLTANARQLAKEFNIHPEEVLSAQNELISKSSSQKSLALSSDLFHLAKAENTGDDPKKLQDDLFKSAGIMIKQGVAQEHIMPIMRAMIGGGRSEGGTLELSEFAGVLPRLTSKAGLYEGNSEGNTLKQVALFQAAYKATGNVGEATTATERLSDDLLRRDKHGQSKAEKFLGHSITRNGKIIGPEVLLPEIFNKAGGDVGKLANAGLNVRSNRILQGYLSTYQAAEKDKKGSGGDAIRKEMMDVATAEITKQEEIKHFEQRMATTAERSEKAWNELDAAVRAKLVPVIVDKFIPALEKAIPTIEKVLSAFADFIKWAADNPWTAAATLVGVSLAKSLAVTVAAEVVKSGLAKILAGVMGGSPAPLGKTPGGGGGANSAATVAAVLAVGGAINVVNTLNNGPSSVRSDVAVKDALKGGAGGRAVVKEVLDEGTGIWGDIKRGTKGTLAGIGGFVGSTASQEWLEDIGTRQHIASKIDNDAVLEGKINSALNQENTVATATNTAAINQLTTAVKNMPGAPANDNTGDNSNRGTGGTKIVPPKK